jgi:ketosteroid isomerase-like protein
MPTHRVPDRLLARRQNPSEPLIAASDPAAKERVPVPPPDDQPVPTRAHSPGDTPAATFWSGLAERDLDAAFAVVDPDAEVRIGPAGVLGDASAARSFFAETLTAFPDLRLAVKSSFTGSDGTSVTELKLEGTQAEDYLGASNQEKHLDVDQVWLLRTRDGRVNAISGYWCQNQLYRRLAVRRLDHVAIG